MRNCTGLDHNLVSKMPDVLDKVTGSEVVIKSQNCELLREFTLQDCFKEGESVTLVVAYFGLLRSCNLASSTTFGPACRGFKCVKILDPSLSLAVLNSRLEMRQVSFVVRTVFIQERSRPGPLRFVMGPSTWVFPIPDSSSSCIYNWVLWRVVIYT